MFSVNEAQARVSALQKDFFAANSKRATTAEDVQWLTDFNQCKRMIVQLVRSAKRSIHYSTFLCDVHHTLSTEGEPGPTFAELLREAVARGVTVKILYNPESCYGNATESAFVAALPGCAVRSARSSLGPAPWMMYFSNNSKFGYHHQKYLAIDGERIMVTGCDINGERAGWLELNAVGYYWHELSVVVPMSPRMLSFCDANFEAICKPPPPLLNSSDEHDAMVAMILSAKESVQLENQSYMSGATSVIKISEAFVARVARALSEGDTKFRAMILTNMAQQDEPSFMTRLYCSVSLLWSVRHIELLAAAQGIAPHELYSRLFIGFMECDGTLVKVHSNCLIVDGEVATRSSSNLGDRSLSHFPTDSELGVFVAAGVDEFQQRLFSGYMRTTGVRHNFIDIFEAAQEARGTLRSVHTRLTRYPDFAVNALMKVLSSTPATGGRKESVFTVVPGGTVVPSLEPKALPLRTIFAVLAALLALVVWAVLFRK